MSRPSIHDDIAIYHHQIHVAAAHRVNKIVVQIEMLAAEQRRHPWRVGSNRDDVGLLSSLERADLSVETEAARAA